MNPILSFPKIESDKSTAEQLAQMKSYLRQFKSEVELILSNIDADNVTQTFEADMFEGFSKRLAGTDTISQISQTTGLIKLSVKDLEESEASLIVTVDGIKAEVYDGQGNSRITQNADAITLKVSKENIVSDLNSKMTSYINITPNKIEFASDGTLIINTTDFSLDANGNATFSGALSAASGTFAGTLSAASGSFSGTIIADGGQIGIFEIDPVYGNLISQNGATVLTGMMACDEGRFYSIALTSTSGADSFNGSIIGGTANFGKLGNLSYDEKYISWKKASQAVSDDDYVLVGA